MEKRRPYKTPSTAGVPPRSIPPNTAPRRLAAQPPGSPSHGLEWSRDPLGEGQRVVGMPEAASVVRDAEVKLAALRARATLGPPAETASSHTRALSGQAPSSHIAPSPTSTAVLGCFLLRFMTSAKPLPGPENGGGLPLAQNRCVAREAEPPRTRSPPRAFQWQSKSRASLLRIRARRC
jgi:hypothetical protein